MRPLSALGGLTGLVASLAPAVAWAQAAPITPPPATTAAQGGAATGAMAMVAVIVGLLIVVGVGVKLYDLKRKREADAVHLQAQISDALLRDQALFGMPITPTAHVPFFRGTPAVIEVSGQVPSAEAREAAMRIIRSEASRIRPDFRIDDHMAIVPAMATRAA
jgi:hypothetical protein